MYIYILPPRASLCWCVVSGVAGYHPRPQPFSLRRNPLTNYDLTQCTPKQTILHIARRALNEATNEMHGEDQQHASRWHMRTRPPATFIQEGVAIAFAEHLMKGGGQQSHQ